MNRKDIEKITAARLGVPVTTVEPFVQAFLETVSDCLMYGHHVTIQRFGSFRPWEQTSRPAVPSAPRGQANPVCSNPAPP